jgi:hypothetical protein
MIYIFLLKMRNNMRVAKTGMGNKRNKETSVNQFQIVIVLSARSRRARSARGAVGVIDAAHLTNHSAGQVEARPGTAISVMLRTRPSINVRSQ